MLRAPQCSVQGAGPCQRLCCILRPSDYLRGPSLPVKTSSLNLKISFSSGASVALFEQVHLALEDLPSDGRSGAAV